MKPFRHVLHINKDEKQPQGRRPWATAVGPLFFLKKFSEGLSSVAKDDFRRDRFCRSIANLTQEDCDVIAQGNHTEAQETIDQWESSYHLYELLVSTFIPLVLVLVLAGWSDRYLRRRLVLLVPLVGTAVAIFVDLLLVAFPRWSLEFLYWTPSDEPRRSPAVFRDGRLRPRGRHLGLHLQDSLPRTPDEPPGLGNGAGDALGPRDPEVFVSVAGVDLRDFLGS
nr:uncharacterized protein LOC113827508 [Penaeus vannamei]